jgi:uncharacterized membrane protein YphA (DoxX/SURF4 family)
MDYFNNHRGVGTRLVRIAMALVFLWFGVSQVLDPASWLGYLPSWASVFPVSANTFILIAGISQSIIGFGLLLGLFTRWMAILGVLHLVPIILSVGYNEIMIRDLGLLLATISIVYHGPDRWCLDKKLGGLRQSALGKLLYLFDQDVYS